MSNQTWVEYETRIASPKLKDVMADVNTALCANGLGPIAGNLYWVDNGTGGGGTATGPGTFDRPFNSIDAAFGYVTANNGDCIIAKPGHVEAVIVGGGLAPDKSGTIVVSLGVGTNKAKMSFGTKTSASMTCTVSNVHFVNFMGLAAVDALTGPISVTAPNVHFYNAEWWDAANKNAVDVLIASAAADQLQINGWTHYTAAGGTQKQSSIQIAGAERPVLRGIRIAGDFATGNIENGTAWVDAELDDIVLDNQNATPKPGIVLQGTSTGSARNVNIRVASGSVANCTSNLGDMQYFNCWGVTADGYAADEIGTIPAASIEGKIDTVTGAVSTLTGNVSAAQTDITTGLGAVSTLTGNVSAVQTDVTTALAAVSTLTANVSAVQTDVTTELGAVSTLTANVSAAQIDIDAVVAALYGAGGIPAYPAAAAAASNVSMAEVLRYLSERQLPRTVVRTIAVMNVTAGYASATNVSQFNVTGDVLCWAVGIVASALTSTGASATISLGTADGVAALIPAATVNGVSLVAGDVWFDATSGTNIGALPNSGGVIIGNGVNIILRVAASNMTAGAMRLYLRYIPLSANGAVVAI